MYIILQPDAIEIFRQKNYRFFKANRKAIGLNPDYHKLLFLTLDCNASSLVP